MIAVYTNVLIHAHRRDSRLHAIAAVAVRWLAEGCERWTIPVPCLVEFYGFATHGIWKRPSTVEESSRFPVRARNPRLG